MFLDRRCRIRDGQWGSVHQRFNGETQLYGARWGHSVSLLRGTAGRLLACCCFDVKKMCVRARPCDELDRSINKEFMGAQRLADGSTVVTECGDNPRVCEVASDGRTILAEIPIQPETENSHQQSRMGRKLANGNYLVPHRVACVKECECGPCAHPAVHGGVCCGCVHM
eukprot:COSAG06_NODE_64_length_26790_cov_7.462291_25_plen_169_part_00